MPWRSIAPSAAWHLAHGGWYGVAVASALLSTLGKEAAATAPLAILLYDRTFAAGTLVGALPRRWPASERAGTFAPFRVLFI